MTQSWGENGQCMMKMNCRTGVISVVMTNRNPEMDQSESGMEWLVNKNLYLQEKLMRKILWYAPPVKFLPM